MEEKTKQAAAREFHKVLTAQQRSLNACYEAVLRMKLACECVDVSRQIECFVYTFVASKGLEYFGCNCGYMRLVVIRDNTVHTCTCIYVRTYHTNM